MSNKDTIVEFQIGYVPENSEYYTHLLKKYSEKEISETGLFYKNEKYPSKLKIFLWDKLFVPFTIILDFLTLYKMGKNIIVIIRKN